MKGRENPETGTGRSEERAIGGRWGELFSFYKLVQFFLKKRVNTTPEPVISTPRAEALERDEARERGGREKIPGRDERRWSLLIASFRLVSSIPFQIRLTPSRRGISSFEREKEKSLIFLSRDTYARFVKTPIVSQRV